MRTFVAVFPPPEVREALFRAARDLPTSKAFRLIGQEKLHLTLKFLGNVAEEDLSGVEQALEQLRGRHEPFAVETSDFGAFPSERKARILWAGIGEGSEHLRVVAKSVDDLLEPVGFGREKRPYVPHLTLGRSRGRGAKLDDPNVSPPTLRFTVSGVNLVESVPEGGGVTYSVLGTYSF
ncbi:MAG TPA: RNA 2',3'-cyclic phosphodiesterase [Rubrobacteraceae bacterium]|nr:RNA 2',3'-cyclic phosphodiesterase [Rubrobacteraceae bacterium]